MDRMNPRVRRQWAGAAFRAALVAAAGLVPWLAGTAGAAAAEAGRPNVLFLLTDDQRADAIGAMVERLEDGAVNARIGEYAHEDDEGHRDPGFGLIEHRLIPSSRWRQRIRPQPHRA